MSRYAAQMFEWDERQGLNMKEYFRLYKDRFPMLGVILEGWYGDTRFDCYDNLQVVRIHCYSSQPRVVIRDSNSSDFRFLTLPVDSQVKFQLVMGPNKFGNIKTMDFLLDNHELPFLVKLACHEDHQFKIGTTRCSASSFGNLLITEKYLEHYYIVNCIDGADPKMNTIVNLIYLTENLSMAPVTGLKNRPKADFDAYMGKLDKEAAGIVYDRKMGNPDFAEYDTRKIDPMTGDGGIPTIDPPAIPGQILEEDGDYIEIPPELPTRSKPHLEPQSLATQDPAHKDPAHKAPTQIDPTHKDPTHKDPKHKDPKHKDPKHKDIKHKEPKHKEKPAKAEKKPAPVCAKKPKPPPAVQSPLAVAVNVSWEKNPDLPARRPQPPPSNAPLCKQGAVPYVNTSVGRATVRPFPKNSMAPAVHDVTDDAGCYELVGTADAVYSEAYGDVIPVSKGSENKSHISDGNYVKLGMSAVTPSSYLMTQILNTDQDTTSTNMEKIKTLTMNEIGDILRLLKLDEYVDTFQDNQVDGAILTSLKRDDLVNELGMTKLQATRLFMYMSEGHIPK
ncbi:uncharacterized protein LOC127878031 isoform X2 [Dreissena polymorpha]|uniref:SAM domain-containing protein n=1 Tax=Dreissena polymorpha TaxID=45954 RepID=A0A9D4KIU2_DREPO|nr:uncharacterized protein LOC127878031 isoform X2 [Dreissena polymorpha]KAH3840638.1 hypothetical protein DPMN_114091 [Dreissena polymorpha]